MGFFDNLSDKLSAGGAKVAEKAKEVSELAALSATVEKEKVVQEKLYNEVGKKFYAQYREELLEKFPEETAKIDESFKKQEEAREALKAKKGAAIVCPGCGKEVEKGTKFCPACGAVIPEVEEAVEEVTEEVVEETTEEAPVEENNAE